METFFLISGSLFFCGALGGVAGIYITLSKIEKHLALIASSNQKDANADQPA